MAQFICPRCGSTYFQTIQKGERNIFTVSDERIVAFVQQAGDGEIDRQSISCCACSWRGRFDELVESFKD